MANASTIDSPFPGKSREGTSAPVLRTEGLTIRFGGLTALDDVNLEIERGEVRAIIGPNGAGKSTFFNCVTGVLRPTAGRVLLNGEDVTGLSPTASHARVSRARTRSPTSCPTPRRLKMYASRRSRAGTAGAC